MVDKIKHFINSVAPEKFFVVVALIFGLAFIVVTPPFQMPDEPKHFFRSYQISEFNLIVDDGNNETGGYIPDAIGNTVRRTATKPILMHSPDKKYDVYKTFRVGSERINENKKQFYDFSETSLNSPVSYLPQSIGIGLGRVVDAPPIVMLYIARLFNLITWIAICALAIHLFPRRKWAAVYLCLLPMSLFVAGSLSIDAAASGIMLLFLALILKLRESKSISYKYLSALLAIAIIMTLSKQIMFVFLPLIFLIPNRLFKTRNMALYAKAAILILPIVFLAAWYAITKGVDLTPGYTNNQVPIEQLKFIVFHPHSYINVLWNTYFFTWGDVISRSFIGSFGWLDAPLAEGIVATGYIGLFLALVVSTKDKVKEWLSNKQKVLITLIGLAYVAGVSTALYMYYSPVGYKIIVGIQGRYFLPLAFLVIPLFYGKLLKSSRLVYRSIVIFTPLFLLISSVITLYVRYYVNNV